MWESRIGPLEGIRRLKFVTDHEDESDISIELRAQNSELLKSKPGCTRCPGTIQWSIGCSKQYESGTGTD